MGHYGSHGRSLLLWILCCLLPIESLAEAPLRVAVASNFADPLRAIADAYEASHGHRIEVIAGSSGKLYAQIRHGAPFDVFLSADSERPRALEQRGIAVAGSRFTYAVGRLALWSPDATLTVDSIDALEDRPGSRVAIANPRLAPYGRAARQALQALGRWSDLERRLVRGENIAQTFHFVVSGNAALGFVALSQLTADPPLGGSFWLVPIALHDPIEQQLVRITGHPHATAFIDYLRSPPVLARIRDFGYATTGID